MFRSADAEGRGALGWEQARELGAELCGRLGTPRLAESQFKAVFEACDEDGDGLLGTEEFVMLFEVYLRLALGVMEERDRRRSLLSSPSEVLKEPSVQSRLIADDLSTEDPMTDRSVPVSLRSIETNISIEVDSKESPEMQSMSPKPKPASENGPPPADDSISPETMFAPGGMMMGLLILLML